ncbi:MAG: BsuPI-related putative proteinase inhibitor [Planctomycetota bacterium]|nr:BsuPI-related putative proteinase inhibitor [Planctomycetota bacterium]
MTTNHRSIKKPLIWLLFLTFALPCLALAQTPYFPVNTGDTWTFGYQTPGQSKQFTTRTIDRSSGGIRFHIDNLHGSPRWIERSRPGSKLIKVWDRQFRGGVETRSLEMVYDFSGNRTSWSVDILGNLFLSGTVSVGSRNEIVETPAGRFEKCVRLDWQPKATDAGLLSEWFAPEVGLVRYTTRSLLGTIDHRLEHAKVNGQTYPDPQTPRGLTVRLQLDRFLYVIDRRPSPNGPNPPTVLQATLEVANRTPQDIVLDFRSSQVYDLVIRDENGNETWRWSANKLFAEGAWSRTISRGKQETLKESVTLRLQGVDLPAGDYTLEFLTVSRQRFSSTAPFQVRVAY